MGLKMAFLRGAAAGLALLMGPEAFGASRTIQFAGMAGAEFETGDINNENLYTNCVIALVNTGNSGADQRIKEIRLIDFNANDGTTSWITVNTATKTSSALTQLTRSSSGGTDNTCIDVTLPSGGFCLVRFSVETASMGGRYGLCSGQVTVEDRFPATPGSMVATGTLTTVQESMVLGGVLSGAYYASGVHLFDLDNVASTTDGDGAPDPELSWALTHNMNFYCLEACCQAASCPQSSGRWDVFSSKVGSDCMANCGHVWGGHDGDNGSLPSHNIQSLINFLPGTGAYSDGYQSHNSYSGATFTGTDTNGPVTGTMAFTTTGTGGNTPGTMMVRTANPHYAGGMVYEMISGPMRTICSGLASYFKEGGSDFTHAGGVDGHAYIAPKGGYPPERLLCNHRHAQDDLFSRTGATTSFAINGGQPF